VGSGGRFGNFSYGSKKEPLRLRGGSQTSSQLCRARNKKVLTVDINQGRGVRGSRSGGLQWGKPATYSKKGEWKTSGGGGSGKKEERPGIP